MLRGFSLLPPEGHSAIAENTSQRSGNAPAFLFGNGVLPLSYDALAERIIGNGFSGDTGTIKFLISKI